MTAARPCTTFQCESPPRVVTSCPCSKWDKVYIYGYSTMELILFLSIAYVYINCIIWNTLCCKQHEFAENGIRVCFQVTKWVKLSTPTLYKDHTVYNLEDITRYQELLGQLKYQCPFLVSQAICLNMLDNFEIVPRKFKEGISICHGGHLEANYCISRCFHS